MVLILKSISIISFRPARITIGGGEYGTGEDGRTFFINSQFMYRRSWEHWLLSIN